MCRAARSRIIENGDLCPEDPEVISCPSSAAPIRGVPRRSPTIKRSSHPRSLGAQTTAAAPKVVKYDTKVTLRAHAPRNDRFIYWVQSESRKCERGRPVVLFQVRPGPDRKLDSARSELGSGPRRGEAVLTAELTIDQTVVYAKVSREVHDEFVCGGDRSEVHDDR